MIMPHQKILEAAFEQTWSALVITDADLSEGCRVQFANPAFVALTGYSLDELRGQSLRILQGAATDPSVIENLRRCLKEGRYFEGCATNYRKDGSTYIVRWKISPIHDENGSVTHFLSVQENISELVRVDHTNRLLSRALDATSDLVMLTDAKSRIIFVNRAFENATGYSLSAIRCETAAILKSGKHDDAFYATMYRTLSTGQDFRATFINRRRDGSIFHIEQTISTIVDDHGRPTHYFSVSKDVTRQVEREQALWRAATKDKLTGLYNRSHGEKTLREAFIRAQVGGDLLSVIIADVDHFKQINDRFGHLTGDRVLTEIARIMEATVRRQDVVIRWGGEEFVIVLADCPIAVAIELGECIRTCVDAYRDSEIGSLTLSLGVAQFASGETIEELIARADAALYAAKHGGRNRLSVAPTAQTPLVDHVDLPEAS
ncbi:diguanylate cyclase [Achromobacter sp. SLBN-14]|uniref:sensor domain-containing diguanylate cyclase n=1 Tax=Achromobacter sp. SLBN-14 TaxID=2768442 RepID=UPI001154C831|nr:diguanylate cyclase [Achromobacter sp. SLBN-14]TQJ94694.1 PAS domain S-box-containing protein/diguanylate cyclase (GGDEF)-like protein [Achromobacter sp. SLBN-14]